MRIFQLIDVLDYGDGVSNDIIHIHELLDELGVENYIYSKHCNENVINYKNDIGSLSASPDDVIIYHFSGKSFIMDFVKTLQCKKILRYHNVTPPDFFKDINKNIYEACMAGLTQLKENLYYFDYFLADSEFNKTDLISYGVKEEKISVYPIAMNLERLKKEAFTKEIKDNLMGQVSFLFVGRIAPNKKIEDIIDVFEEYYKTFDSTAKLFLVGNNKQSLDYFNSLENKITSLISKNNIIFTGKIADEDVYTFYKFSSAFICMSEHEGFCIPILEAQYFGLPVIAYNSSAVPFTMGEAGILLYKKDSKLAAKLLYEIVENKPLKNSIIDAQYSNIAQYLDSNMKDKLSTLVVEWRK